MPTEKIINKTSPSKADLSISAAPASAQTNKKSNLIAKCSTSKSTLPSTLTHPRFTIEEKKILYGLFRQHEDVIDIKNRKGKHSVAMWDAWQAIVHDFNQNPKISIRRNVKQIQKFWFNARLRKQYTSKLTKDMKPRRPAASSTIPNAPKPCDSTVSSSIKCEPELILRTEVSPDTTEIANEYEEIYLERISNDPHSVERLEDSAEASQNHQKHPNLTQLENVPLQEHEHATTPSQHQINFDNISAEKLTLNDLLQFKDAQPHEEIIIQIKHPDGRSITIPSSNCINIPHQQITYNQVEEVGESKCPPQIQMQPYPKIIQANFQQQFNTFATQNLSPTNSTSNSENTTIDIADSFENKINVFKMKEAELRQKEIKLQSEEKRIELYQMEEKLRHKKEMHQLQVEEIKIKIRILCEEEKQLRNIKI